MDIVYFFNEGYSPEMIVGQFPTLPLSLVYKVVAFYLEHRDKVDAYVEAELAEVESQRRVVQGWPNFVSDWRGCRQYKPY